jgi:hypothetical protein
MLVGLETDISLFSAVGSRGDITLGGLIEKT